MIELKITGANAQDLGVNAIQTLALIVNGAKNMVRPAVAAPENKAPPEAAKAQQDLNDLRQPVEQTETEAVPLENPSASEAPPEITTKRKPGRPPKKAPTLDLPSDPIPDFSAPAGGTKPFTEADCRTQVRLTLENFEKRAREAIPNYADLKGNALDVVEQKIMRDKVAYTKPLLAKFGVGKVSDLKPEQYADFMAASVPFVDGTAETV